MLSAHFNLNRYLFVCKVNSSMVWLPVFPSLEFSLVLGTAIAERLPTVQARQWRKSLALWDDCIGGISKGAYRQAGACPRQAPTQSRQAPAQSRQAPRTPNPERGEVRGTGSGVRGKKSFSAPEPRTPNPEPRTSVLPETSPWPIDAAVLFYPGKRAYGRDELILWELKLMGESADHGLFLELILPALEEAGSIRDSRWEYNNCLWGRFDIHSVFMAKGPRWEPVVSNGHLNLKYKAGPRQWSRGLKFESPRPPSHFDCLNWITAFDLDRNDSDIGSSPSLRTILDVLTDRLARLILGNYYEPDDFWLELKPKDRSAFRKAIEMSSEISVLQEDMKLVPAYLPGRQIGKQIFREPLPDAVLPYLGLASVFHIGKHTQFGCGTFLIN